MLMKKAESVSAFKVANDNGCRRVSVFGMGWTGYTLPQLCAADVFEDVRSNDDMTIELDIDDANTAARLVVFDNDLAKMAHYFYNLGRQHGIESALEADLFD